MPFVYSYDEYVDMILVYGECHKNARLARDVYAHRYPNRITPCWKTFSCVERTMRRGVFPSGKPILPRQRPAQRDENLIAVLAYINVNPHVSIRVLEEELGISKSTIHRILKKFKYRPYKINLVQGLKPEDPQRRLNFIQEINNKIAQDPHFLNKILWSDESRFHNNGTVNRHNCHYWSAENPGWVREAHFQNVWGTNVWCGLFNGHLIGPYFYDGTLTGDSYLDFLGNSLLDLLEDIPLQQIRTMWWQQDGAPPHFARQVTEHLDEVYRGRWIGRNGPILWPPRSPDITPLDFFLWGYLKDIVYTIEPRNLEDLKNRIRRACQSVTPEMVRGACIRNLQQRFQLCVRENGQQFEHL